MLKRLMWKRTGLEVSEIRSDQIEPPPRLVARLNTEFIDGMGKVDEKFMILLNIDRVFQSEDRAFVQVLGEELEAF